MSWPPLLDYDETWRKKLNTVYQPHSPDVEVAYLDFSPSTTGTFSKIFPFFVFWSNESIRKCIRISYLDQKMLG